MGASTKVTFIPNWIDYSCRKKGYEATINSQNLDLGFPPHHLLLSPHRAGTNPKGFPSKGTGKGKFAENIANLLSLTDLWFKHSQQHFYVHQI
jgi:hypothetical protein